MGINALQKVQNHGWDHKRKDMGASNYSKRSIETCVLQVINLMNSIISCFESCHC